MKQQGHFEKGAWVENNPNEYCEICGFKYADHPNYFQQDIDGEMKTIKLSEDLIDSMAGGGVGYVCQPYPTISRTVIYNPDYTTMQPSTKYSIEETYDDLTKFLMGLSIATIIILVIIYILFY